MSPMEEFTLSWEAATERILDASALPASTPRAKDSSSTTYLYYLHYLMGVQPIFDVFRSVTGATPKKPWGERLNPLQWAIPDEPTAGDAADGHQQGGW